MLARARARLDAWWADSPRARRLPGMLLLPAVLTVAGAAGWLFFEPVVAIYCALITLVGLAMAGFAAWSVLTGRRY